MDPSSIQKQSRLMGKSFEPPEAAQSSGTRERRGKYVGDAERLDMKGGGGGGGGGERKELTACKRRAHCEVDQAEDRRWQADVKE